MLKVAIAAASAAVLLSGCVGNDADKYVGCWQSEKLKQNAIMRVDYGAGGKSHLVFHVKQFPSAFWGSKKLEEKKMSFVVPESGHPYLDGPMPMRIEMVLHNKNTMTIAGDSYQRTDCKAWNEFDAAWEKELARREAAPRFRM